MVELNTENDGTNSGTVDFSGLILGFSSAALYYMGEATVEGRPPQKNLPLARQNIEFIRLLQTKTKNNLLPEEDRLIRQLIHDLQLKMIAVSR
ncbi:MAG: DUF1844 domain-containing protein [Proteobacteria bacterium]|nr:DUF1844 domain-containing protein [Pseudomonadota bacterium]